MIDLNETQQLAMHAQLVAKDRWLGPNNPDVILITSQSGKMPIEAAAKRENELVHLLRVAGLPHKRVYGQWQGDREFSYAVVLSSDVVVREDQIQWLHKVANSFQQDAILHLNKYREASLITADGQTEYVGLFRDQGVNEPEGDWTYDPDTGHYYAIV